MPMLSPSKLLERCNEIRRAGGAEELGQLLPGHPSQSNRCLIAVNLNFDCQILYGAVVGAVCTIISKDRRLETVASTLGLKPANRSNWVVCPWVARHPPSEWLAYELPDEFKASAEAFDRERYPDELYA